ncbi:TPA: hypothetical protein ACQJST_003915 [Klebsiella pneumoniae]|nr:hypothetical protein [Klebsiella pneumoniae]HBT5557574.1 hypothetical protein [Klebsiella pneumoniae]HBT5729148.1 hypothetical protein [Klebsiella pneumoniae]HBT5750772.1 hypothetical protein [Klebsiella pneumoniae]
MANPLMPECLVMLNNLLQVIENAPVECDGHTLMISSALNHAGISHQRMCGVVKNHKTDFELYPHFWIQIGEFTLDYRLRMWVELYSGENLAESAPHGIFVARGLEYIYTSESICPPPALDFNLLNLISDGYYEKINFSELTTLAHSVDISLISDFKNITIAGIA